MDALHDPSIETVIVMSSAQVGKTEILLNIIGYHIAQDPAPILMLQPTLEMGQAFSKDRLAPMLRDTPALRGMVKDPRARDSGNTLLHKSFPGGHITLAGANSAASLASRPIRVVLCDEVDRYPVSAGTEGDPVSLARNRAANFWNRKIVLTSTPTIAGSSRIEDAYEHSDQRQFLVPCPDCGHEQPLSWAQVSWPKDEEGTSERDKAAYACSDCGALWGDGERWRAVARGRWVARKSAHGVAGFHLSALYSPWTRLADIAEEHGRVKDKPEQLKTWVNTKLGETWEGDQGEGADWEALYRRREHYTEPPEDVKTLVAGVDVQDDRLEFEITGYGAGEESWAITYERLYGDPGQKQLWKNLEDRLRQRFRRSDGAVLDVQLVCIDSGGHYTDEVYAWARKVSRTWIIPIQGANQHGKPIANFPRKANAKGVYLTTVGTDTAKELIYGRFGVHEPGPGYCHWPVDERFDETYFQQVTAEKKVRKYKNGVAYFVWDAGKRRNEALDCRVYSLAAVRVLQQHMGLDLDRDEEETEAEETADAPKRERVRRKSSFWR